MQERKEEMFKKYKRNMKKCLKERNVEKCKKRKELWENAKKK